MSPYVRGVLIGMALAVIVAALTACGSADTPAELYTPPPAQDFLPVPRPPSTPQPVYPADPAEPVCDTSRLASHDLAGVCRRSPATMGALEAA